MVLNPCEKFSIRRIKYVYENWFIQILLNKLNFSTGSKASYRWLR